ncbi:flagellin lysine-N-methylase [Aeromonas sp. 97A]|uniref:flagellin lysine-N-methylase n=1 Tax=Aeromonas sp. 97A TaxID=3452731 RepID=UPI003F7A5E6F
MFIALKRNPSLSESDMAAFLYTPHVCQHFQCIGDGCKDNCCHSWTISIDKATFRSYEKHPDRNTIPEQTTHPQGKESNEQWGVITLDEQGACPFLDEKRLCQIHGKAGPDALSQTCKTYPRTQTRLANQLKKSLVLSCPEVCRHLLLDPMAMQTEETPLRQPLPFTTPPSTAMATLHSLSIHVLTATDLPWRTAPMAYRTAASSGCNLLVARSISRAGSGNGRAGGTHVMFDSCPPCPHCSGGD